MESDSEIFAAKSEDSCTVSTGEPGYCHSVEAESHSSDTSFFKAVSRSVVLYLLCASGAFI